MAIPGSVNATRSGFVYDSDYVVDVTLTGMSNPYDLQYAHTCVYDVSEN